MNSMAFECDLRALGRPSDSFFKLERGSFQSASIDANVEPFCYCEQNQKNPTAFMELTICGADSMLRPVLVGTSARAAAAAAELVTHVESHAWAVGVRRVFLLTAMKMYFQRLGYVRVMPEEADVATSLAQKLGYNCTHAALMVKIL